MTKRKEPETYRSSLNNQRTLVLKHTHMLFFIKIKAEGKEGGCSNPVKPDAVSVCSSIHGKISTSIHITLWSSIVCHEVECVTFSIILSRQPNLKHFTVGTNRGQSFALAEQTHTVRPAKRGVGGLCVCGGGVQAPV